MVQHADALLDAPSVGGVAELLDHGAVELLERLAAVKEPAGGGGGGGGGPVGGDRERGCGEAEAARGQVADADAGARGAQRVRQALGGPRAWLADDRDVHAAIAV